MLKLLPIITFVLLTSTLQSEAGPVVGVITGAVAAIAGGASIVGSIAAAIITNVATGFISMAAQALFKSKGGSVGSGSTSTAYRPGGTVLDASRHSVVRDAIAARKIIYGRVKTSGVLGFIETTNANKHLHQVVMLAGHEIDSVENVYFNQDVLPGVHSTVGSSVTVGSGKYYNLARINFKLGSETQTADTNLASDVAAWTTAHRLQGIAYIYARMIANDQAYPQGIPNISAIVKGKKLYDPRTTGTTYSPNPALAIYDYLTNTDYGVGIPTSDIDTNSIIAAANICEEPVPRLGKTMNTLTPINSSVSGQGFDTFILEHQKSFRVTSDGSGPGTNHHAGFLLYNAYEVGETYVVTYTLTFNSGSGSVNVALCTDTSPTSTFGTTHATGTARTVSGTYTEFLTVGGTLQAYHFLTFFSPVTDISDFTISNVRVAKRLSLTTITDIPVIAALQTSTSSLDFDTFNVGASNSFQAFTDGINDPGGDRTRYAGVRLGAGLTSGQTYTVTFNLHYDAVTSNNVNFNHGFLPVTGRFTSSSSLTVIETNEHATFGTYSTSGTYTAQFTVSGTPGAYQFLAFTIEEQSNVICAYTISNVRIYNSTTAISTDEWRYSCNGILDSGTSHAVNLEALLSSCAGNLIYANGKYRLLVGSYSTPIRTLDEDNLAGPIAVKNHLPRSETFNAVRGTFVDADNGFVDAEYPVLRSGALVAADGEERFVDLSLPMTTSASLAQRLAKIKLLQSRQAVTAVLTCNMSAYEVNVGETIMVNNEQLGWDSKEFEVLSMEFSYDSELRVVLHLRETAEEIYAWTTNEDTSMDFAPNTNLADTFQTVPVRAVDALPSDENYEGRLVFLTTDSKLYRYNGSSFIATTSAADITSGSIDAQEITISGGSSGLIKSDNFASGSAGWKIDGAGDAEFNDVTIRGKLANTGSFFSPSSTSKFAYNAVVSQHQFNEFSQFYHEAGPFASSIVTFYGVDSTNPSANAGNRIAGDEVVCLVSYDARVGWPFTSSQIGLLYPQVEYRINGGSWTNWVGTRTSLSGTGTEFLRLETHAGNCTPLTRQIPIKPTFLSGNETAMFDFRIRYVWLYRSTTSASPAHPARWFSDFSVTVFNTSS